MIMVWLVNSMEEEIGAKYMCYSSAKSLWDNVTLMYSDLGNQPQLYELQLKLEELCHAENYVIKYFNILKGLW